MDTTPTMPVDMSRKYDPKDYDGPDTKKIFEALCDIAEELSNLNEKFDSFNDKVQNMSETELKVDTGLGDYLEEISSKLNLIIKK